MAKEKFWLNIDLRTQRCTIHTANCSHRPHESEFKNVRSIGRDGGWMPFLDYSSILKYKSTHYPSFVLWACRRWDTRKKISEGKKAMGKRARARGVENVESGRKNL